jgi:hypothetical protein
MPSDDEMRLMRADRDLLIITVMFVFWSVLFILIDTPHVVFTPPATYELKANPGCFGALIALALWRRWSLGRVLAIMFSFFFLVGSAAVMLHLFPLSLGGLHVSGPEVQLHAPDAALRVLIVPFFLAQLWQIFVLLRSEVRVLFLSRRGRAALYSLPPRDAEVRTEILAHPRNS